MSRRLVRSGPVAPDLLAPAPEAAPRPVENHAAEQRRIVKRLQVIIATHVESAWRMRVGWSLADVERVIAALEAEADGLDPKPHLFDENEIVGYLRGSLYEELLGEPSNIFYTTQVGPEVMRYEPLPKAFWKGCLALLRTRLDRMQKP